MSGLLWTLAYAAPGVVAFRIAYRALWNDAGKIGTPDGADALFCLFFAAIAAGLWPVTLPVAALWRTAGGTPQGFARLLGGESKEAKAKRLHREVEDRQEQIRRLERDVGLGG